MSGSGGERARQRERPGVDYYALLGVPPGASSGAIRAAFRRLAKQWHPDASQAPSTAERFRLIVEAYDVLSDPARRLAYDARHGGGAGGTYGLAGAYAAYGAEVTGGVSAPRTARPAVAARAPRAAPRATPAAKTPQARGAATAPGRRAVRPNAGPVTAVAPIGGVGAVSARARASRAAAVGAAPAVRAVCVECGAPAVGNTDRCVACLRKYGTFQEHLARAAARVRR